MGTLADKKALQKKSNMLVAGAIVGSLLFYLVGRQAGPTSAVAMVAGLCQLAMAVPWFWGLAEYCKSKGYSPVMSLLGLLYLLGLVILLVLPDKYVLTDGQGGATGPSPYYRQPATGAAPPQPAPVAEQPSEPTLTATSIFGPL